MLAHETEVWGNASSPGSVKLRVESQPAIGQEEPVYKTTQNANTGSYQTRGIDPAISYGAFSLQPLSEHLRSNDPHVREGGKLQHLSGKATCILTFAEAHRKDVEAALRSWITFGGMGGRTRRGFGAVSEQGLSSDEVKKRVFAMDQTLPMVPSLHGARVAFLAGEFATARDALASGLAKLQKFRQGPNLGRNPGRDNPNRPGRSRWPEPELIRELTRRSDPQHRERFVGVDKVPRWVFGMPIVFHFQSRTDPGDTELRPRDFDRMASPLIIRPFTKPNGKYSCVALALSVPGMEVPLVLKKAPGDPVVQGRVTQAEAKKIAPLAGATDPLAAFLDRFAQ